MPNVRYMIGLVETVSPIGKNEAGVNQFSFRFAIVIGNGEANRKSGYGKSSFFCWYQAPVDQFKCKFFSYNQIFILHGIKAVEWSMAKKSHVEGVIWFTGGFLIMSRLLAPKTHHLS